MKPKTKKYRGSRTHGYGRSRQHRKHGRSGGHGRAGWCKHKWSQVVTGLREPPGKHGFSRPYAKEKPAINLDQLNSFITSKTTEIDVTKLGYYKVLGMGNLKRKVIVKAYEFSRKAKEKLGDLAVVIA